MTNIEALRSASDDELAALLDKWIWHCTSSCPALSKCRDGIGCAAAIRAWLNSEVEQ